MTFEEKATDEWYNNSQSTAQDLIKSAIDEGYTREEAEEKLSGTKWAKGNSNAYKKAWKQYDNLLDSDNTALQERRRSRIYGHKKEDPMLFPELNEETAKTLKGEPKVADTEANKANADRLMGSAKLTDDKYRKIIEDAKKAQGPKPTDGRRMKIETVAETEEPEMQLGWMLSDEGFDAKNADNTEKVTAKMLVEKMKAEGLSREEAEARLVGTKWENRAKVTAELERQYPEEAHTPTAAEENVAEAQEPMEEETEAQKEMRGTLEGVDLSDGLSYSEAQSMADKYMATKQAKADMYLNYLRKTLGLKEEDIKRIVDSTSANSQLRREFYNDKPILENLTGVSGSEIRSQNKALDAMENKTSDTYKKYSSDAEQAGKDVSESKTYDLERNPTSVLRALKDGEFGNWKDPKLSPEEAKEVKDRAIGTALYLGGDVVATALRNIGASYQGRNGASEDMWTKRQKSKFESATENKNKTLDAATETEVGGKQKALDFSQSLKKAIDDGRLQKMIDSLGEDIKADDILRNQANYRETAEKFKSMTLEQKANVILGMEMDGNDLSTPALIAILASLSGKEYEELGKKVADLALSLGKGVGAGLKGLFGNFFREPAPEGSVERTEQNVEDIGRTSPEYRNKINEKLTQIGATFGNPSSVNLKSRVAKQIWERNASTWGPYNPDDNSMKEAVYQTYLNALANPNTPDGRFILMVTDPDIYGPGTHGVNPDGSRSSGVSF